MIDQQRMTFADVEYLNLDSIGIVLQNFDNSKNAVKKNKSIGSYGRRIADCKGCSLLYDRLLVRYPRVFSMASANTFSFMSQADFKTFSESRIIRITFA